VSNFIVESLAEWVQEEQRTQDIDEDIHKISVATLSSSANLTGERAVFDPAITTSEEYEALTVAVYGAVKHAFQYPATLSDLKLAFQEKYSAFGRYAEEHIGRIPETDGIKSSCVDLTEKIIAFNREILAAYKYFLLDTKDSVDLKELTTGLMVMFSTIDTLITEIRQKVFPSDWDRNDDYRLGFNLLGGDTLDDEEMAYDRRVTLDYVSEASDVNNTAWSLLQYVISVEEQKSL
jgi:hypothetical protein